MIVWGIVGWKNSGKTGLVERLVAEFTRRGRRVSTVKHAHHGARIDQPGTDTARHAEAGARQVVLAAGDRWAMMNAAPPPDLNGLIARLDPVDIVLVEGFKTAPVAKIECHRATTGQPLLAPGDPWVRAVASDTNLTLDRPVLALNDTDGIADYIERIG